MNHATAQVTRAIRATVDEVWAALTEPDRVRAWWGELSDPLQAGCLSQLALEDGDVYLLEIIDVQPPRRLELVRRLYGIGPRETIRWEIAAGAVTVSETALLPDLERRRAERAEWLFYTDRLEKYLLKAALPPVPRAREFVLDTALPGDVESVRAGLGRHLQRAFASDADPFVAAHRGTLPVPGGEPVEISVGPAQAGGSLPLELRHAGWRAPTAACLHLRRRDQGTTLTVQHGGWAGIAFDDETRVRERARFARFWHKLFMRFTLDYADSWRIPTLSPLDLRSRMERPQVFVFDANRATLWERGHVPRSVFVGQEDIPVERLPADRNAELVFYCRDSTCLTAFLSAAQARTLGYANTFVMEGGRAAWARSGLPLVSSNGEVAADQAEPETLAREGDRVRASPDTSGSATRSKKE